MIFTDSGTSPTAAQDTDRSIVSPIMQINHLQFDFSCSTLKVWAHTALIYGVLDQTSWVSESKFLKKSIPKVISVRSIFQVFFFYSKRTLKSEKTPGLKCVSISYSSYFGWWCCWGMRKKAFRRGKQWLCNHFCSSYLKELLCTSETEDKLLLIQLQKMRSAALPQSWHAVRNCFLFSPMLSRLWKNHSGYFYWILYYDKEKMTFGLF